MSSSRQKINTRLLVLLMGVCLAASPSYAAQNPATNSAPKPGVHTPARPAHPTTTPVATKERVNTTTTAHHATHRNVALHSSAGHDVAGRTTSHVSSGPVAKGGPNHSTTYASQHKGAPARHYQPRPPTYMQRMARLHLQPQRVEEIQRALIREGYLQGEPNGQWDARTHDAMLRYQTMNGFPVTGLPEAKSLMKLGLGSHPLPPELDHGMVATATPSSTQSVFTVTPVAPTSAPAVPPYQEITPPQNK